MATEYLLFTVAMLLACSVQPSFSDNSVRKLNHTRVYWASPPLQDRGELQTFGGRVFYPSDQPDYDVYRKPWQTFFSFNAYPAIIVQPLSSADVVKALTYAKNRNLHVSVRNGGHSYAGLSRSYGMVLDLQLMNSTTVLPGGTNRVTVGPGQVNIGMYYHLAKENLVLPGGGCPSVGISGLTLGGGFGILSPKLGMTADRVLELEAVIYTATGVFTPVKVTPNNEFSDLFFAFRGGMGGNYGVVTSWTYQAEPIERVLSTTYKLNLDNVRMADQRGEPMAYDKTLNAIQAYIQWCDTTNNDTYCEMTMSTRNVNRTDLSLHDTADRQLSNFFELEAICQCHVGDSSCTHCQVEAGRLAQMLDAINQTSSFPLYESPTRDVVRWPVHIWTVAGCEHLYEMYNSTSYANGLPMDASIVQECAAIPQKRIGRGKHNRKKSLFMNSHPSNAVLMDVITWFDNFSSNVIVDNFTGANIEFFHWKGSLRAQPTHPSAWTHRNQKWLLHITGRFADEAVPATIAVVYYALDRLHRRLAAPFMTTQSYQDYQNFADASLSYEAWSSFYFDAKTLGRLITINKRYNPLDMFRTELSIPVGHSAAGGVAGDAKEFRALLQVLLFAVFALCASAGTF